MMLLHNAHSVAVIVKYFNGRAFLTMFILKDPMWFHLTTHDRRGTTIEHCNKVNIGRRWEHSHTSCIWSKYTQEIHDIIYDTITIVYACKWVAFWEMSTIMKVSQQLVTLSQNTLMTIIKFNKHYIMYSKRERFTNYDNRLWIKCHINLSANS